MITSILVSLLIILIFLLLIAGLISYLYYSLMQRPTQPMDGEVSLPGLSAAVEVLRDRHGIPHIYAENRADLFRAQGYLHARDRLWLMEQNRRVARGTLSEIFGEAALEADRFSRIVGFRRCAEAELATLDDELRRVLDWYAEGVNAFMAANPGRLGAEFNLLRFQPEPWQPVDTLAYAKVVGWSLSVNWEAELTRLQLVERLGPVRAAELEADYPAQNPVILEALQEGAALRMVQAAGLLLNEYEKVREWMGALAVGQGSNSWVLAPKATTSRRPILCNDPHLAVQMPGVWYENHLICPDYEVSGASLCGVPAVVIGHNEQIAWGITNALTDIQDLYVERQSADDPALFEYEGAWEPASVVEEQIRIRRRDPVVERVVITRHGPLITSLLRGNGTGDSSFPSLSLRWTGHMPGNLVGAILKLNAARDWSEFQSALAMWSVPPLNFTYADADGNIGYALAGAIPKRAGNLGLTPAAGWLRDASWDEMIPPDELPRVYNPESGILVTANNKWVGDDYPHFLGDEYYPGWRAARLENVLREKERHSLRDMQALQLDTLSTYAKALAPWFARLEPDDEWEKVAVGHLRRWDFRMDSESTGAAIFHFALLNLMDLVFGAKLGAAQSGYYSIARNPLFTSSGFILKAQTRLLQFIENESDSWWYGDTATGAERSREAVLAEALRRAVAQIRAELGDNARRWNWGRIHQVRFVHPLGSVRLFRAFFNRGPYPVGGDETTPNQTRYAPALPPGLVQVIAGYRQIYEVGVWDNALTVTSTGQSGHPLSEQYADQIVMWREGVYHPMPWSRRAVEEVSRYRLRLKPATA